MVRGAILKGSSFIYSYTFNYKVDKPRDNTLKLFQKSIECASKFSDVTLITDDLSLNNLEHFTPNVIVDPPEDLLYLDDFKMHVLNKYRGHTIIDPDIFLFKPLNHIPGYDIYAEFNSIGRYNDFKSNLEPRIKLWKEKGFEDYYPDYFSLEVVPNIGLLFIEKDEIIKDYLHIYNQVKTWVIDNVDFNLKDSRLIGEYSLGYLAKIKNYKIGFYRNMNNNYDHYAGEDKYDPWYMGAKTNNTLL